jgi:dihydroorotase
MSTAGLYIRSARVVDPLRGVDAEGDLYIEGGRIAPRPPRLPAACRVMEARGLIAAPGFWDIHVHLREPGGEDAETVASGSACAVRGGFTTILAMPNTRPPVDRPAAVRQVLEAGGRAGLTRVLTTACITRGREGREVADLDALAEAGASAFTDDGCTVQDDAVMASAMERVHALDGVLMDHAQDKILEARGVMHEGAFSRKHGLPGIPTRAEERIVRRDIELAERTGCRLHVQHVTSRAGMALLRAAAGRGAPVTWEVTPHHLALTDEDVRPDDANFKMNPPLRGEDDRLALLEAVTNEPQAVLATDHAPHTPAAKARGFREGPFGVLGLETALGLTYDLLVGAGRLTVPEWLRRWTVNPARALGRRPPCLAPGETADVVLIDTRGAWTYDVGRSASRSRNSPFHGRRLGARAAYTVCRGRCVWEAAGG